VIAGNQQVADDGAPLPVAPVLLVKDQAGRPVRGATVKFAITGGGGKIESTSATTDSAGTVAVKGWTLGPTPGQNTLSANTGSSGNRGYDGRRDGPESGVDDPRVHGGGQ
jgi:hypothetical protein